MNGSYTERTTWGAKAEAAAEFGTRDEGFFSFFLFFSLGGGKSPLPQKEEVAARLAERTRIESRAGKMTGGFSAVAASSWEQTYGRGNESRLMRMVGSDDERK